MNEGGGEREKKTLEERPRGRKGAHDKLGEKVERKGDLLAGKVHSKLGKPMSERGGKKWEEKTKKRCQAGNLRWKGGNSRSRHPEAAEKKAGSAEDFEEGEKATKKRDGGRVLGGGGGGGEGVARQSSKP